MAPLPRWNPIPRACLSPVPPTEPKSVCRTITLPIHVVTFFILDREAKEVSTNDKFPTISERKCQHSTCILRGTTGKYWIKAGVDHASPFIALEKPFEVLQILNIKTLGMVDAPEEHLKSLNSTEDDHGNMHEYQMIKRPWPTQQKCEHPKNNASYSRCWSLPRYS